MPLVSIIIPTYNQGDYLREALQSVLDQTMFDWEAIVVNNFSSDNTLNVVAEFRDNRFKVINFSNDGVIGASRNVGIRHAKAPWVAFLDSDDIWYSSKLAICMKEADKVDIVAHRFEYVKNDNVVRNSLLVKERDFLYRNLILKKNCLTPTAVIVRKTLLNRVDGFSERTDFIAAEDFDLWLKLSNNQARLKFCPQILAKYRLHDSNNSKVAVPLMCASLKVLRKHYNLLNNKRAFDFILYRRIIAIQYYGAGRNFLVQGNRRIAIRFFLKSFIHYPFFIKNYILFLGAIFSISPEC
jgi:glycosyltransferase involved in cell wall biosynthesis